MARKLKTGTSAADQLTGSAGDDLIYAFDPDQVSASVNTITATRIQSGLDRPLYAVGAPGDPYRLFVVEQGGLIKAIDLATRQASIFLDLSGEVVGTGEIGLLGLAFSPDFATNRKFYVFLSNPNGDTEIREYQVAADNPNAVNLASERPVLLVDLPSDPGHHRAGWLGFGPDDMLYIPLGDGGDPANLPQNPNSLLGKVLRIDVNGDEFPGDADKNYSIPDDNPFVGQEGEDEIWALGLRNPFRDSFDRGLGTFFIADVGQGEWEEINIGVAGANYGWPLFEGPEARSPTPPDGFTFPIHAYDHSVGRSVIGGYVYRGQSEGLQGQYFFADFISGRVSTLVEDAGTWSATNWTNDVDTDFGSIDMPVSFGEDARGDLYLVDYNGEVFLLTPQANSPDAGDTVHAKGGDDQVYGGFGNDQLFGDKGADYLYGMSGNDKLVGGTGADWLLGGAGNDTLNGGLDSDILEGGQGHDTLQGGDGNDSLLGGEGDDNLVGGLGMDKLTGGSGADKFRFNTALNAATNVDQITDFSVTDDRMLLDDSVFTALPTGTLAGDAFYIGSAAHDPSDRIIYNNVTGAVVYDQDGTGPAAATLFAQLAPGLAAITSQDFLVV